MAFIYVPFKAKIKLVERQLNIKSYIENTKLISNFSFDRYGHMQFIN